MPNPLKPDENVYIDAQILLATTNLTIHEIASKIGVSGGNYLCTIFKKKLNMSPTEYKKSL